MEKDRPEALVVTDKFSVALAIESVAGFASIYGDMKMFAWRLPLEEALQIIGTEKLECAVIRIQNDIKIPSGPISLTQSLHEQTNCSQRKIRPDLKTVHSNK
jgi:hypothetical protein